MAIPDADSAFDEEPVESDLTTTAQVLSARDILDRLENDAADDQEKLSTRDRRPWWRQLLHWVGLK